MSNFREGIKNRTMDSFLVVLQKLLSCSSRFSQSTKQESVPNLCWPEGPDNEKCPCGNLGKFCQAQILISCGWIFWWPVAAR